MSVGNGLVLDTRAMGVFGMERTSQPQGSAGIFALAQSLMAYMSVTIAIILAVSILPICSWAHQETIRMTANARAVGRARLGFLIVMPGSL